MAGCSLVVAPATTDDLAEAVRAEGPFRIEGLGSKGEFRLCAAESVLSTRGLRGVVEHSPQDQVVVVRAGTTIAEVQAALKPSGDCLPLPDAAEWGPELAGFPGTIGGGISMNLPHGLQEQCGSWRDWVLGMTVVRADGTVAKCGSHAVKNVAGYDVQKLFVGARGSLCVIAEVVLRTFPLRALPAPKARQCRVPGAGFRGENGSNGTHGTHGTHDEFPTHPEHSTPSTHESHTSHSGRPSNLFIQRTLRTDLQRAIEAAGNELLALDEAACTLWLAAEPARFADDRVTACRKGVTDGDENLARLMLKTKQIFDPGGKLNPGEWGVF